MNRRRNGLAEASRAGLARLTRRMRWKPGYEPVPGQASARARRLVEFCLGDHAEKPPMPCTENRDYLQKNEILLLSVMEGRIEIDPGKSTARKNRSWAWDQKQVVKALIEQRAVLPERLTCWLVRGDTYGRQTDPEQGLHVSGMRSADRRDLVLVPTHNRQRFLGPRLAEQMRQMGEIDTPWQEKGDSAWWGGAMTGRYWNRPGSGTLSREQVLLHFRDKPDQNVHLHLTEYPGRGAAVPGITPAGQFEKKEAFRHKCVVMLPGNDIASSSSWLLAGNSVVLMPPPHLEHILYFELEPWKHYVPLENDPADISRKLRWVIDHPGASVSIVENAHRHLRWLTGPEYLWACNEVLRRIAGGSAHD